MKINFIYLLVFVIFVISIYNLFYKPGIYKLFNLDNKPSKILNLPSFLDINGKLFCSITGYKCQNDSCNCKTICKGQYNKFKIYENDNVVMFNEKLSPGTYCLPKGFELCNIQSSTPIYSSNGWVCISKNPSIFHKNRVIACQNSYAEDNSKNFLIDVKENKAITIENITNFYEIYNGKMRYKCACNSNDKSGNKLIHLDEIPFKCVSDYCLAKLKFRRGIIGWDDASKQCNCGHLLHENPNDLTSPCLDNNNKLEKNVLSSTVHCLKSSSLYDYHTICHANNVSGVLNFTKTFILSNNPLEYLNRVV